MSEFNQIMTQSEIDWLLGEPPQLTAEWEAAKTVEGVFGIRYEFDWHGKCSSTFTFHGILFGHDYPLDLMKNTFFFTNVENLNDLYSKSWECSPEGIEAEKLFYRIIRQCGYERICRVDDVSLC